MIHLVEQILGLVGLLIGLVLDWPFLLVVFLVWLVSRFRNQIGSMLDRRSAIGAGDLSKKIHNEVDPITQKLGLLTSQVSDLQSQMRRVEDVQSIERQNRMLKPIVSKVEALETLVPQIQAGLSTLAGKEIPQQVQRGLDPVNQEIKVLKDSLGGLQANLNTAASAADLADLKSGTERVLSDLDAMKDSLNRVDALVKSLATKEELEGLKSGVVPLDGQIKDLRDNLDQLRVYLQSAALKNELDPLKLDIGQTGKAVQDVKKMVAGLQSSFTASPWNGPFNELRSQVEPLRGNLDKLSEAFETLRKQTKESTPKAVTEKLQKDLQPLGQELAAIKAAVESLTGRIDAMAGAADEMGVSDSKKIEQEFKDVKEAIRLLQSSHPSGNASAKPKKKGKGAPSRPAAQG